jgi:uncharacterized protein YutE (UPF0331/DUF86 family)
VIDSELVRRKISLILADLRSLEPLGQKDVETYRASPTDELVAERYFERIIGRMIDINYHLVTELGRPPPRDYHLSFKELGTLGVLDGSLATRIAACAGLRNRRVHEYDEIDPRIVHEAIRDAARDIPEYLRQVELFLEKSSTDVD